MTDESKKTFGMLVRQRRLDAGIGLRELAKMINKSPSYLSEIESNRVPAPSAAMIVDIVDALGADRDEFLAAASKVDPMLADYFAHRPEAADFLRKAREYDLDGEGWRKMEMLAEIAFGSKEKK